VTQDLPNVVLIVLDTARRDRFGCYGNAGPTTPTVDSLARDGMLVRSMIANAPWTPPSHASLFTGLYPSQHECQWGKPIKLDESIGVTMAEWFKALGYETVCMSSNGLISAKTGLSRGFDHYAFRLDLEQGWRRYARRARRALLGGDSGGGVMNQYLKRKLPGIKRPMFLFVNYLECHWAYAPRPSMVRRVGGPRFRPLQGLHYRLRIADRKGPWDAVGTADDRRLEIYSTLYNGELASGDRHVSHLLDCLERSGHLSGNTVVLVASDHGEHLGEHGLADHHGALDDILIHVPFVAWGPGIVEPGLVKEGMWELVDVFPSLARLLDKPLPAAYLEGRRAGLFSGRSSGDPNDSGYAFSEWRSWNPKELDRISKRNPSYDFHPLARDLVCVRDERYKLVRASDGTECLYDCVEDHNETTDMAPNYPMIADRLSRRLDEAVASWVPMGTANQSEFSESERLEIEQRLAALGYI
jgi:arylsulfatase A-like enzyme